jgi:hypothetical protein
MSTTRAARTQWLLPNLLLALFMSMAGSLVIAPRAWAVTDAGAAGGPAWPAPPPGTYRPPLAAPVIDPFRAPAQRWLAGNRGLEYGVVGGEPVRAVGPRERNPVIWMLAGAGILAAGVWIGTLI